MNQHLPQNRFEQAPVVIRDRGRFASGSSGNPGGRPRVIQHIQDLARQHTSEAIETLLEIMKDKDSPSAARVGAATALLDRAWGRPRQAVEISAEDGAEARTERLLEIFQTAARTSNEGVRAFVAMATTAPAQV